LPIEKVDLPPRVETSLREDGTVETKEIPQWEINATGKEVYELEGIFKNSAPDMMHETWKEWKAIGEETITKPDGSTDVVRADWVDRYKSHAGFCVKAVRPTFTLSGMGGMKAQGIIRQRVKWTREGKEVQTVYRDGRKETTFEEALSGNHDQ
jgi:hypothetical protein